MDYKFRKLRADEVEARVGTVTEKGCSILIYKDARCDMRLLDETVGPFNWQRVHKELKGVIYCGIGIKDPDTGEWVYKWDCGTESYTEAQKGEASDSFKRAGFNWGIGRELYDSPFIWFPKESINLTEKNGKPTTYDRFEVTAMEYDGDRLTYLQVVNTKTKKLYTYGQNPVPNARLELTAKINELKLPKAKVQSLLAMYSKTSMAEMSEEECRKAYDVLVEAEKNGK